MSGWDFSNATITLAGGVALNKWSEYTIDSDFLVPTDGWSFTFGTETEWARVRDLVVPDRGLVTIDIDGQPQLTGWVDKVRAECSTDGVRVTVEGRDFLRQLVKANVHPATRIKDRTLAGLLENVVGQIYQGISVAYQYDNAANRQVLTGSKSKHASARKKQHTKILEYCQPHANESAFEFVARNLRRFGLWLWAGADGTLILGAPDYDQPASYQIIRKAGDAIANVERASWEWDRTNVPSHVFVRGRSASKDWDVQKAKALVEDPIFRFDASSPDLFCPMMISHDEATTDAECQAFAWQELTKLKQDERVYSCTVKGHRDPRTGLLYAVDTIAHVEDEPLGINDDFWVIRRTFRKSATSGTTTELRMIPKGVVMFLDSDAP